MTLVSQGYGQGPPREASRLPLEKGSSEGSAHSDGAADAPDGSLPRQDKGTRKGAMPFFRVASEFSRLDYEQSLYGQREGPGLSSEFRRETRKGMALFGGRFTAGLALPFSRSFTLAPGFSAAFHTNLSPHQELTIAGVDHDYTLRYHYWSLGMGSEFQFVDRLLLLSFEIGAAGLFSPQGQQASGSLEVTTDAVSGLFTHFDVGLRWPRHTLVGVGGTVEVDAMFRYVALPELFRLGGGVFLDVDFGRPR